MTVMKEYELSELQLATGDFDEVCLIGEGGFGRVYRAMVQLTPVAIKVMDPNSLQGLAEFHNEVQLSSSIDHPHIVRLLGFCSSATRQCLVYELMANGSLEERLAAKDPGQRLPYAVRVRMAAQAADALGYLHARAIIHRDIKPANVFLDCNLNAKLGDIGLAERSFHARRSGEAIGTWPYLAPEYKTHGQSSPSTDVYAWGLMMLQIVTAAPDPKDLIHRCQRALETATLETMLDSHAGEWPLWLGERLVKLALWCCMHTPEERPAIAQVAAELARLHVLLLPNDRHATEGVV